MYTPVSEEIFTIECNICEYNIAYFYEDGSPEKVIAEDGWHKIDKDTHHCSTCYIPPFPEMHLDKWTIQDLLLIAPPRDYHTRTGIIHHIQQKITDNGIDWIDEELQNKYGVIENES